MMCQGKHVVKKDTGKFRKYSLLVALVALAVAVSIGFTVAFLVDKDNSVTNTFTPGEVACEISEEFSGTNKTVVTVKNTGNIPAYIRVAVVANKVDANGNIVAGSATASFDLGSGWVKSGDYYYYTSAVAPNDSTGNLLSGNGIPLNGIQVTILAEAIQADGFAADGTTAAVQDAWGVDPTSLGGAAG